MFFDLYNGKIMVDHLGEDGISFMKTLTQARVPYVFI
jgi:hypothetical protein